MCRGRDMNVLVMDVEGTDGRERGEDQVRLLNSAISRRLSMPRRTSNANQLCFLWRRRKFLLSIFGSIKLVYIKVPTWGFLRPFSKSTLDFLGRSHKKREFRFRLTSMPPADLSCFSASQRTLLLFVIRDHIGTTPLANLQATLTADLQRIWETLSKPAELQDRKLTDYFDLSFTALPHKVLAADKFEADVRTLRGRFTDKSRDDFIFKSAYHKRIPADGVAFYMEGIWVRKHHNAPVLKPTDTFPPQGTSPDQQGPRLTHAARAPRTIPMRRDFCRRSGGVQRAGQAAETTNRSWQCYYRTWRNDAGLAVTSAMCVATLSFYTRADGATARYDRDASRYHPGVYKRKRADLTGTLDSTLLPLFVGQLKNLHKVALTLFKAKVVVGLKVDGYNFADVVSKARAEAEAGFSQGAREAVVTEGDAAWEWEEELRLLREEVQSVADHLRKDETKKMINAIEVCGDLASTSAVMLIVL